MKIGFIAVSGLRLGKPELLELGMTFPDVASRAREIQALPSLGLLTLAGMTPDRHEIEYHEIPDVDRAELPGGFDAVAISCLTATANEALRLSARYRAVGVRTILGGLFATLAPGAAIGKADAVVIGEGEAVWPEILADLEADRLKSVYDARLRPNFDLADAPMPAFHLLSRDRYPRFTVQTQRGCPLACEFCAASMRLTPKFKVKPAAKVAAEIRALQARFGEPFVEFADDNTFVDRARSRELLRALAPLGIQWFTESDLSIAEDDELLRMMRDAGCRQVLIGFESPDGRALEGIELRSNWKARRVESQLAAVEKIQRRGITVNGCFVLGLDGAGPESFEAVREFVARSGVYDVQITYLTAFPGTPLHARMQAAGRLIDPEGFDRCTLFDPTVVPEGMTVAELESGFANLVKQLYDPEFVRERGRKFLAQRRAGLRERNAA